MDTRLPDPRRAPRPRAYRRVAVSVCVGVALSVAAFTVIRRSQTHRIRADFESEAGEHASAIKKAIEGKLVALESLRAFMRGHADEVGSEEFNSFARPLLSEVGGIRVVGWAARVRDADRAAFEARLRAKGFPGFQITEKNREGQIVPASQRPEYFPLVRVAPMIGNEAALGFDPSSAPDRREMLQRARDTGRAALSEEVLLVQDKPGRAALLVALAVYADRQAVDTVEARRKHLVGFVTGALHISTIMEAALGHLASAGIDVHVFGGTGASGGRLLYDPLSRRTENAERARGGPGPALSGQITRVWPDGPVPFHLKRVDRRLEEPRVGPRIAS